MPADIFRLGKDAKCFRNSGANYASPTWVSIDTIKDVSMKLDAGKWDGSRRASGGWKQQARTMMDASFDLDLVFVPADAGYIALRNAFIHGTLIDMAIMTGDLATDGNEGLRAEMNVFSFGRDEKLEEGIMLKITLGPGVSVNAPAWVTSNTGTLTPIA